MSRHPDFVPQGVIPAVLLPFHEDLSIDEPSFRAHLRDVGGGAGTVCDHDQRPLDRGRLVHPRTSSAASWRSRARKSATRCRSFTASGRTAAWRRRGSPGRLRPAGLRRCWCFRRRPSRSASRPRWRWPISRPSRDATDLPLIVFQYPLATGQGYPAATLERLFDEVPTIRAIKDWTPLVPQHESTDSRVAGAQASHQRAVHQQRMASEFAGARLQWPAFRQRQRHRRSAGQTLSGGRRPTISRKPVG